MAKASGKKGQGKTRQILPVPATPSLPTWEREMDRFFDELRRGFWPSLRHPERWWPRGLGARMPAVDVYEDKDHVVVKAEIPGMEKGDIHVELSDSTLTIRGEKKKEEEVKEENFYRSECTYGSFVRTVDLPAEVKSEAAKATFRNGVLEVRVPKTEEAKRRQVRVEVE